MTDPSGIKPIAGNPAAQNASKGQVVQIVSLPDGLQNNARAIRLSGEVVQQNEDGSVRVRTPQGDIDIQVRGRQPQPGQHIEIDVPPGNPPKQATIRPAPAQAPQPQLPTPQTPPTSATPLPHPPLPPTTRPPAQGQPTPLKDGTTQPLPPVTGNGKPQTTVPAQDVFQPTPAKPAAPVSSLPPLQPGTIVKLVPMPQGTAPQIENPAFQITTKTAMQTSIVAQKSEGNLITTLLQAVKSVMPQSAAPQATGMISSAKGTMPVLGDGAAIKPLPANISILPIVLPAKVISIALPSGQSSAPIVAPLTPQTINAAPPLTVTVTQMTPQNQPVISIPMNDKGGVQNFILQSPPASVPIGSQVTLQPQPIVLQSPQNNTALVMTTAQPPVLGMPSLQIMPPTSMLPPAWRSLLPMMQPASLWPVMDELFQTFYQATPQAAQILGRTLPSPGNPSHFGPAILLFAAALKSGELQSWLGDKKLEMVQKLGKESLLARLSGESSSISSNTDAPATEWKSFPVPMLWQNEISKVMFHVRKEPSEQEQQSNEGDTRFVMDLSLTRMGEVQLDGMVRGKELNLIVRTQIPISYSMQDAMRLAYAKALDGTDIYGEIGFQAGRDSWETVLKSENVGQSV